jgi:hypothetical protein
MLYAETYPIQLNISREGGNISDGQESLRLLCKPCTEHSPESQKSTLKSIFLSTFYYYFQFGLRNYLIPYGFPIRRFYVLLILQMRVTCPAHLTVLDLITLILLIRRPNDILAMFHNSV